MPDYKPDYIMNMNYKHHGILVIDENNLITACNSVASQLLGVNCPELIGKSLNEYINIECLIEDNAASKSAAKYMINGLFFEVSLSPLNTDNTETGSMAVIINRIVNNYSDQEINGGQLENIKHNEVIAESGEMLSVLNMAKKVAQTDSIVLITGESGAGKEIIARIIHKFSDRSQGSFIQINCGAIPENLLEAELFGYESGAFTGARKQGKLGLFELANNGTVLLDEIAEMPINLQVKLLRVLQEQETFRLGGTKSIQLNARVIAVTNKNLWDCIEQGTFREDLLYRINVVPINVPSLRQRHDDIIPLVMFFFDFFQKRYQVERFFEPSALKVLEEYQWPGNVRELKNVIERLIILSEGNMISERQVSYQLKHNQKQTLKPIVVNGLLPYRDAHEMLEKDLLQMAINRYKTTRKAAQALGIAHSSVVRKLARHDIKSVSKWSAAPD